MKSQAWINQVRKHTLEKKSPTSMFWIFTQTVNFLMEGKDWGRKQIIISRLQLVYENTGPRLIYFPLSQKPTISHTYFYFNMKVLFMPVQWTAVENKWGVQTPTKREKEKDRQTCLFFFKPESESGFFCWFWILDCSHYILNFTAIEWNASNIQRHDFEINKQSLK